MSDVRYSYLHGPHRHVTIARSVDLKNKLVYCGISVCHPDDVFYKVQGRTIATGRLEAGKDGKKHLSQDAKKRLSWVLKLPGDNKPLETIMYYLAGGPWVKGYLPCVDNTITMVPTCVKELAQEWRRMKRVSI